MLMQVTGIVDISAGMMFECQLFLYLESRYAFGTLKVYPSNQNCITI